ncbi:uncharacterized protein [Parasteatoda tepidariorum]|uniref:uncharacterized protein n=1 Tax=Parasteatoda tepidariorum TaxID=114398 RepID=UPI001C718DE0|nr:uncharacterized protein LOC122273828 [Parasteatoda tepidariorum]
MLHCANECSKRHNADYITFGEFCVYASELKSCYDNKIPRPTPLSKTKRLRRRNTVPQRSSKYQVFLGGSCNPTTWRKDIAIPTFKSLKISYYNPVSIYSYYSFLSIFIIVKIVLIYSSK